MKKVLILIGDAGGGHIACARALKQAFDNTEYEAVIRTVKSYDAIYSQISRVNFLERIFNYSYILTDKYGIVNKIFSTYFKLTLSSKTDKIIKEEKPDIVISNHSMTALSIGHIRKKKQYKFKFIITVPDLITVSRFWIECEPDLLFSPTQEATEILRKYNKEVEILNNYYPLQTIPKQTGQQKILIREELLSRLNLDSNKPTILITGCGFGTRNIVKNMNNILTNREYQFIILVGKDEKLKHELESKYSEYKNIIINGYTDEMLNFLTASDIIIAKTGPATILEIEGLNKKAIFTQPVGYQEWGNIDYLKKNPNFRFVGDKYQKLTEEIQALSSSKVSEYDGGIKNAKDIVNVIINRVSK